MITMIQKRNQQHLRRYSRESLRRRDALARRSKAPMQSINPKSPARIAYIDRGGRISHSWKGAEMADSSSKAAEALDVEGCASLEEISASRAMPSASANSGAAHGEHASPAAATIRNPALEGECPVRELHRDASDEEGSSSRPIRPAAGVRENSGPTETGAGTEDERDRERPGDGGAAANPRKRRLESSSGGRSHDGSEGGRTGRCPWKHVGAEDEGAVPKDELVRRNAALLEGFLLEVVEHRNSRGEGRTSSRDGPSALSPRARTELLEYVRRISTMYRDAVPFHNFAHATHVTSSAAALLRLLCAPRGDEDAAKLKARTHGLGADPLARFAIVFASLVHDVDHRGVPNAQLVREGDPLAKQFGNRSVAERRSIAVAWDLLAEDGFRELRRVMFEDEDERRRFKSILDTAILATDIADRERMARARERWREAFQEDSTIGRHEETTLRDLRTTLVIEQIMQASDVAHTMQRWETFLRWNGRLRRELSRAYREGRGTTDPREGWYRGEIGFFDHYIIPLARRLEECGALGDAAAEILEGALENRRRWEETGREVAEDLDASDEDVRARAA